MQVITDVLQYLLLGNEVFVRVSMHFASNATKQPGTISYLINNEPVVVVGVVVCVVVAVVVIAAYSAVFFAVVVAAALAVVFIYFCIIITRGRINIQMQEFSSTCSQNELSKDDVGNVGDVVLCSLTRQRMLSREVVRLRATYNCPCVKTSSLRSRPTFLSVCPGDLFIVMA